MSYTFITGATSGIGRATAREFAEHGHNLIITGRRSNRLEELKSELENENDIDVVPLEFDIRNLEECKNAVKEIDLNEINILINNAGLAQGLAPIHEADIDDWETMIDTNVKGLLYMTRLISPYMVENNEGHIINTASTSGKGVYQNGSVYCATKHAVDSLTQSIRLDLHEYGIRVSQVAPGHVEETEFAERRFHGNKEKAKIYEDFNPLTSSDVAEAIYFISSRPPHVNIQDIVMMGTQQADVSTIDRSGRKYD